MVFMLQLNRLTEEKFPLWNYERFSLNSSILGKTTHFGRLIPSNLQISDIKQTVYLLHGGGGDDSEFVKLGIIGAIDPKTANLFHSTGTQIILPFIGKSFLHNHPEIRSRRYFDHFREEIMSLAEADTKTISASRYICGYSMGGRAALSTFLRNLDLFAGTGAHFPMLFTFDYSNSAAAAAFASRCNVDSEHMNNFVPEFKNEFVNEEDFASYDPINLMSKLDLADISKKKIYFDIGTSDEFGLFEGTQHFHNQLTSKDIAHKFESIKDGRHDGPFIFQQMPKLFQYLLS